MNFKLSIQKFTLLTISTFLMFLFLVFMNFYYEQQERSSELILHSLGSESAELNYIVSKSLKSPKDALEHKALLERIAVNNDFIELILIHDGQNILVTTDPFFKEILPTQSMYNSKISAYENLMQRRAIEEKIRFYQDGKLESLYLTLLLDHKEIKLFFAQKNKDFLLLFTFLPLFMITLIWMIIKKIVISPLELLRQFAYYHNKVPEAFMLRELEAIRHSMVETFTRLENEKKELYEVARTDSLSGLANRNALMEYLERLIAICKRDNKEFAMLFLDLDRFKSVNDLLGHNVGDQLLKQVSSVIEGVLRPHDFVARVGGDEFVVILQEYKSIMELTTVIDRVQKVIEKTWIIHTNPIHISSSIGIAFYPKDGNDIVSLMKNSDIAMYEAKKNGRSGYHFFTQELNKRVHDTIVLEKEMKEALVHDEYELYYQPKVDIKTGKIIAAEALIRWNHPKKGIVPPNVFIPLAEEDDFILVLGQWIIQTAIRQQSLFRDLGIDIVISINLSPKQLLKDDFATDIIEIMQEFNVDAKNIDIEITENLFFQYNNKNIEVLNTLHEYGCSISLDDFGTGYSSLSYLKDFPIDCLKIDKAFMDDFNQDRGRIFIETIVKMGQTLNLKIIAEGVEYIEQLDYLKTIDCDEYQGYLCAKPLNTKEFINFYTEKNGVTI